jgi:hypothetical protein
MSYNSDFQRAFVERSLLLISGYSGPYDATILLNCLLGLVIVPNEQCFCSLPADPLDAFEKVWGIPPSAIVHPGDYSNSPKRKWNNLPYNLRLFVRDLRNAIAHFCFSPVPETGEVQSFKFWSDRNGFVAQIQVEHLRTFVERLANRVKEM